MITEAQIREKLDQISTKLDVLRISRTTGEHTSLLPKLTTWSAELYGLLLDPNAAITDEEITKWLAGEVSLLDQL